MRPPCAPEGARSEREGAPHDARGRACAAPRHLLVRRRCCASKRACAVTQSCRASIVRRTATTRRPARPLGRRRCSEPRSRSQPAGRHALAVSSEGALRLRCSASSVACASEFKPLYRRESVRESEPRERGQGFRVPVCACAGIGVYARVLGPTQLSSNCHRSETCSLRNQRRFLFGQHGAKPGGGSWPRRSRPP